MYKSLVAGGRFDKALGAVKRVDPPLNFADILYPVIKEQIVKWATGPSSFTVLGLLEAPDFSSKKELLKILRSEKKSLEAAAAASKTDKADDKKSKSKGKSSPPEKGRSGGNQGAKLLLEKLAA
jgi:pumilio family protein 6